MIKGSRIGIKELNNGRIVTQDRDLYRVDGYLMDIDCIPSDTLVPFELEMKCFELPVWHDLSTINAPLKDCTSTTPGGWYCGVIDCDPDNSTWNPAEVFNYLNQEICQNGVDLTTFEQQSIAEYENAGVTVTDECGAVPFYPWGCGDLDCSPDTSTWTLGRVINYLNDEFCDTLGSVDPATFKQQSTVAYQNAGVSVDVC